MTYAKAETAQDIARLLRSGQTELVIDAPRQSGKTTELIKFAEEKNPNGRFTIVCLNQALQKMIIRRHWEIFNRISQADIVAKRLLGEKLNGEEVNEPTILIPPNLYFPNLIPVYADDWNLLPSSAHRAIMRQKLFIAAVGGEYDGPEKG